MSGRELRPSPFLIEEGDMTTLSEALKEHFETQNAKDKKQKETIALLAKELEAAKRLLWTAIYVNDGEVRVPDDIFIRTENNQELECFYDKEKHETVLRAKISIPEFKASANVPGKA
jgi:hypothetical protein